MRRLPLAALAALCAAAPAAAMDAIVPVVPAISAPISAPPVLAQLRADLALVAPPALALPPSAVMLSAPAWTNIRALAAPAAAAPALPSAEAAVAAAAAEPPAPAQAPLASATEPAQVAARARLAVAGDVLGRFDPAAFAALPEDQRQAALAEMWDGWRRRGLVADPAPAPAAAADAGRRLDALILAGVDDKSLTHANKSIFLGVGVLGYPLADALWLTRTSIRTAIEDNTLSYPEGQRWRTTDGTPEFLGTTPQAQKLVDDWGAAAALATQIVRQAEAGSTELPRSDAASPEAAAAFARVAADLVRAGDREALAYLSGRDPTFSAFLLDARKPGYYLYNGERAVVDRILAAPSAQALGLRRVEHSDGGSVIASTYLYRPARVVERLREAAAEVAEHSDAERRGLAAYAERAAPLAAQTPAPRGAAAPYAFVEPEFLPGSALDSARNRMSARAAPAVQERAEMPLSIGMLRGRLASGERHPFFSPARWAALETLARASPAFASAPDAATLRFVAQPFQSGGRLVSPLSKGPGATLQLAALDDVARLETDPPALRRELRFLSAALQAALR